MAEKFVPAEAAAAREAVLRVEISHLREYNQLLLDALSAIRASGYTYYTVREIMDALRSQVLIMQDRRNGIAGVPHDPHPVLDLSDLLFARPAHVYLAELSEKLMRVPATYNIDQGDVSQVAEIADRLRDVQENLQ